MDRIGLVTVLYKSDDVQPDFIVHFYCGNIAEKVKAIIIENCYGRFGTVISCAF